MSDDMDTDILRRELVGLFKYVERVRAEIAAINSPADEDLEFEKMGDQLDAIVKATEEATNTIMERIEQNDAVLDELRGLLSDADQLALIDKMATNNIDVFQACSFQDITGQRVSKLVKSVTYVADRVNALIATWGKAELENIEVRRDDTRTEDEKLLHGPQLENEERMAQDEIDALFE